MGLETRTHPSGEGNVHSCPLQASVQGSGPRQSEKQGNCVRLPAITESPPTPSSVTLNCRVFPSSLPGI